MSSSLDTPRRSKSSSHAKSTKSPESERHGKEELTKRKRRELRKQRHIRQILIGRFIRILLYIVLGVGLLAFVILALTVAWDIGTTSSVLSNIWTFQPIPVTYPFDEFAVSSNSEMCNELARILRAEGHSFFGITTAVMICLAVTEPNRNGLDDPGVAVFVDMKKRVCQHTYSMPTHLFEDYFKNFLLEKAIYAIFNRVDPTERATLEVKLTRRFRNYPVSKGLANYIYTLGSALHFKKNYGKIFYNDLKGSVLREGDIFVSDIPDIFKKLKGADLDNTGTDLSEDENTLLTDLDNNNTDNTEDSWHSTGGATWMDTISIPFAKDRAICVPNLFGQSSIFLEILPWFPEQAMVEKEFKLVADSVEVTTPLYMAAYRILWPLVHRFRSVFVSHHHNHHVHREQKISFSGSFFTIVDRREQLAIAFSGTHRVKRVDSENDDDPTTQHSFQPLIVHSDHQIETVWAGPGGRMGESLEIPRMVYTLLFHVILRAPIERAVTMPLFFPYGQIAYYTEGISWVGINELRESIHFTGMSKPIYILQKNSKLFKMDTASAIEIRKNGTFPIFFDRGGISITPNGF